MHRVELVEFSFYHFLVISCHTIQNPKPGLGSGSQPILDLVHFHHFGSALFSTGADLRPHHMGDLVHIDCKL